MITLARTPRDIGHAIRTARKARNLTQKDLALRSGVWQETISKIENGVSSTRLDTIFDILASLDMELQLQDRTKGSAQDIEDIF